jgi:hypothetical protein
MNRLEALKRNRDQILLAEIATLIHDLGKMSQEFIIAINNDSPDMHYHILRLHHLRRVPPLITDFEDAPSFKVFLKKHVEREAFLWVEDRAAQKREAILNTCLELLRDRVNKIPRQLYAKGFSPEQVHQKAPQIRENILDVYKQAIQEVKSLDNTSVAFKRKELQFWLSEGVGGACPEEKETYQKRTRHLLKSVQEHYRRLEIEATIPEDFLPARLPKELAQFKIEILEEKVDLASYIELHHGYPSNIPDAVRLLRAQDDGVDGFDSWVDKGQVLDDGKQPVSDVFIATAFGYEPELQRIDMDDLAEMRLHYADTLTTTIQRIQQFQGKSSAGRWQKLLCAPRSGFRSRTENAFRQALGETRRSANDVTLWDHCYSTASLYKAALAKMILEDGFRDPINVGWRFLRVAVDGLAFWGQAHHITDMLGRRIALTEALDRVQQVLEIKYPVGNEIYRDENGSVFVMPALEDPKQHARFAAEVEKLVYNAFVIPSLHQEADISGEILPHLVWNGAGAVRKGKHEENGKIKDDDFASMVPAFGELVNQSTGSMAVNPQKMKEWWQETEGLEVCTVCGMRPIGYRPENVDFPRWVEVKKAKERHVCCVCLFRRGRRAQEWLTEHPDQTIWADETVDINGRFALLLGKFDLNSWLGGTLVRTMLTAFHAEEEGREEKQATPKNPSPARIRRCWETTKDFWKEVEEQLVPGSLNKRYRLEITPQQLEVHDEEDSLGKYHTYELEIEGRRMGVVWDPLAGRLLTTEYLLDLARRWDIPVKKEKEIVPILQTWLAERANRPWSLYEPSAYNEPRGKPKATFVFGGADGNEKPYTPHIPLLTEPARFMALVPADKAMDVAAAIREKYEREMSKVQDRLPLHLGVVIAKRRTPLRAVLDAGRALLERPSAWQAWTVESRAKGGATPEHLADDAHFTQWWKVTLKHEEQRLTLRVADRMGDGETEDRWHAHFCTVKPGSKAIDPRQDVIHASRLTEGATVYLKPATFDFEYLDTTARRFAIAYDDTGGRRLGRASRPYLLNEIETLAEIWRVLNEHLASSQILWIHGLIEEKRRSWHLVARSGDRPQQESPRGPDAEYTDTFVQFVKDTLRQAEWKDKQPPDAQDFELLVDAAIHGVLADVIDLYHEALKLET